MLRSAVFGGGPPRLGSPINRTATVVEQPRKNRSMGFITFRISPSGLDQLLPFRTRSDFKLLPRRKIVRIWACVRVRWNSKQRSCRHRANTYVCNTSRRDRVLGFRLETPSYNPHSQDTHVWSSAQTRPKNSSFDLLQYSTQFYT
jgi:hypothetical protein